MSLVGGTASFANKNVGTDKVVTLSGATLAGADADNYTLELVATATANITPKPITVAADDKTKVYGSADPALTVTVPAGTLESGDSLSGELERATGKDVGSYAITRGSLTAGGNYDLTVTPGTLTIAKKAITVSADDKTKVYGSADPALTVTVPAGALESGDSLSGELERATGKDVGSYAITQGSLTAGGNYDAHGHPRHPHDHPEGGDGERGQQVEGVRVGRPGADDDRQWLPGRRSRRRQDHLQRLPRCRRVGRGWPLHDHPVRFGRGDQPDSATTTSPTTPAS